MKDGARILVRTCANVRATENVVIVTDAERMAIARAVADEALEAGAVASIVIPPERSIDNEEPGPAVAAALSAADVVFLPVTLAMAHTRAVREAIAAGARVLSMTAFTERMMREGGLFTDFSARQPLCRALAAKLTAEGVFVCDGSIPYYSPAWARCSSATGASGPVTFRISEGFVTRIEGGDQAAFLAELLARQDDPWVYNLAQFAFGLNPACTGFTGEMLNDEGVNGTVHIGIGTSANLGGSVSAKTHFDAIARAPTVWIDDEPVLSDGEILVDR